MTGTANDPRHMLDRDLSEERVEAVRAGGGVFVEAVRATRVPMLVTDPALPGNPVVFANGAFLAMAGYAMEEVIGRGLHFMNRPRSDPARVRRFEAAVAAGRDETLDLLQYRKDGSTLWAPVFVSRRGRKYAAAPGRDSRWGSDPITGRADGSRTSSPQTGRFHRGWAVPGPCQPGAAIGRPSAPTRHRGPTCARGMPMGDAVEEQADG